ncbi:Rha family transcriptional regulator [Pseudomonas sp. SWRI102]|uniref:Rha family transcriptional regulator n=1 Tax=Pseudomonas marvdashtae TaxID=2745500 RepID=A0A923FPY2_9PSED|nr:Rha family transcriptional regulator [Pseudomonas marvdashtae]MBV4553082.1 Rha family transcriptional regulator [Pseudomonas marvdashtae]
MHSSINTGNTPANVATRFAGSENVSRTVSMSSIELVEFINSKREQGQPVLTHKNLMAKVPRVLGADQSAKFSADYMDSRSRSQKCFIFPKREACLIAMSYSYELQALVFDRMTALEDRERARAIPSNPKIIGELAILECFDRLLKPAPSSKMMMLAQIATNNGLDAKFLPGYAIDAAPDATGGSSMPTKSATALLKDNDIRCSPAAFNTALASRGFLKQLQRKNSKGEMVLFWSVTEKGLQYGKNLTSPQSPRETQPHWYVDRFLELAKLIGKGRP